MASSSGTPTGLDAGARIRVGMAGSWPRYKSTNFKTGVVVDASTSVDWPLALSQKGRKDIPLEAMGVRFDGEPEDEDLTLVPLAWRDGVPPRFRRLGGLPVHWAPEEAMEAAPRQQRRGSGRSFTFRKAADSANYDARVERRAEIADELRSEVEPVPPFNPDYSMSTFDLLTAAHASMQKRAARAARLETKAEGSILREAQAMVTSELDAERKAAIPRQTEEHYYLSIYAGGAPDGDGYHVVGGQRVEGYQGNKRGKPRHSYYLAVKRSERYTLKKATKYGSQELGAGHEMIDVQYMWLVSSLATINSDGRRFYQLKDGDPTEAVPTDLILTEGFDMVDASTQISDAPTKAGYRAALQRDGVVALSVPLHARIVDAMSVRAR